MISDTLSHLTNFKESHTIVTCRLKTRFVFKHTMLMHNLYGILGANLNKRLKSVFGLKSNTKWELAKLKSVGGEICPWLSSVNKITKKTMLSLECLLHLKKTDINKKNKYWRSYIIQCWYGHVIWSSKTVIIDGDIYSEHNVFIISDNFGNKEWNKIAIKLRQKWLISF